MQIIGAEYELRLQQRMSAAGLAFWSEGELRQMGLHKTPDCKLQVRAHHTPDLSSALLGQ